MFIALYGLINKKSIIKATKQAQRDLNNNDSGLLIVHTATRIKPGSRGLKKGKKLSKFYLDTI
jgi:hypothetical protein